MLTKTEFKEAFREAMEIQLASDLKESEPHEFTPGFEARMEELIDPRKEKKEKKGIGKRYMRALIAAAAVIVFVFIFILTPPGRALAEAFARTVEKIYYSIPFIRYTKPHATEDATPTVVPTVEPTIREPKTPISTPELTDNSAFNTTPAPTEVRTPEPTQEPTPEPTAEPTPTNTPDVTHDPNDPVPAGYNRSDYMKALAFLEQTVNGIKNGESISEGYDPGDPSTWGYCREAGYYNTPCFEWTSSGGEKRLYTVNLPRGKAGGYLDLSGCGSLVRLLCSNNGGNPNTGAGGINRIDLSGCYSLREVYCGTSSVRQIVLSGCSSLNYLDLFANDLHEISLAGCPNVKRIHLGSNPISHLDLSANTELEELNCDYNDLTSLDLSHCPKLASLVCKNNSISRLDLTHNPLLPGGVIEAEGNGYIGYTHLKEYQTFTVFASPTSGASFLGWYDENGEYLSDREYFECDPGMNGTLTARFS